MTVNPWGLYVETRKAWFLLANTIVIEVNTESANDDELEIVNGAAQELIRNAAIRIGEMLQAEFPSMEFKVDVRL